MSAVGVAQCAIDRAMGAYDGAVSKALAEQYSTDGDPVFAGLDRLAIFLGLAVRGDREARSYVSPSATAVVTTASSLDILSAAERHIYAAAEARASALDAVRRRIEATVDMLPPRPAPVIESAPPTVPEITPTTTATEITVSPSAFGEALDAFRGLFNTPSISDFIVASAHVTGVPLHHQDPETARLYRAVVEEAWRRHRGEGGERQGVAMEAA